MVYVYASSADYSFIWLYRRYRYSRIQWLIVEHWITVGLPCTVLTQTENPKVIWEEPRRHPSRKKIATPQSPHWLQWDALHLPPKLPLLFNDLYLHLIHPSLADTTHHPTGNQIQSAIFPQFTHQTDRPADGIGDNSVPTTPADTQLIAQRRG